MSETIKRSALVWHSAERMFDLVNDIAAYPDFLPWCSAAKVLKDEANEKVASLEVSKGGIRQTFTTCNRLYVPSSIEMALVEGPFTHLTGEWNFEALSENGCKVILSLHFALNGRVARLAFGSAFSQAANTMVDAFCQRADAVYGEAL